MRFLSVALAASTVAAHTVSTSSDLDGSVWANLNSVNKARSFNDLPRNRPVKRQSGWNPPSSLATPLKEVWDHCLNTYSNGNLFGFKNYGWDQLMATEGKINMCVRWESSASVSEADRTKIATATKEAYQKWFKWLYNYDNFPFSNIEVNIVGWAVRDKSLLQGSTDGIDVYTDTDAGGAPQCAESCGRFFHQDGDYSRCAGGADRHYDQSLWLTDGMGGGAGGDWGQRIGREYFMSGIDSGSVHILLHEMGHTFGLDDFYDWTPTGISNFIMLAGSSLEITDFDGWMLRNWWYELSRNRGWQSTAASSSSSKDAQAEAEDDTPVAAATTSAAAPAQNTKSTATDSDSSSSAVAGRWQQCGGASFTGPTTCAEGLTCTKQNDYYSQCL